MSPWIQLSLQDPSSITIISLSWFHGIIVLIITLIITIVSYILIFLINNSLNHCLL